MNDPKPQEQSRQPDSGRGGQPSEQAEAFADVASSSAGNGHSIGHSPEVGEGGSEAEPPRRGGRLYRSLYWFKEHQGETVAICAVLMVIIALISLLLSGVSILGWGGSSAGSQPGPSASAEPITVIPQIKRTGVRTWGELVEMPDDGGRVLVGLRIENSGSRPITGLAARASLPPAITAIEGKCRYGIDQIARTTCSEAVIGDGMQLPGLQPGQCLHVVFMAGVSEDAAGGHYVARLSVTSDQTSEISKSAEVKVPATIAEEAVRGLFSGTEEERDFWNGRPEMAPRSKRLLIAQWQEFTLEHAHSFGDVPGGPSIGLSDLFYDHVYEGKVVELKVQVLGPPSAFPLKDGFVKQSVEVGVQGEHARLRCYTPRSEDHRLQDGDEVEIKAVPIAWSPPDSPGNRLEVTMAVCAAARVVDG